MKKLILTLSAAALLASCGIGGSKEPAAVNGNTTNTATAQATPAPSKVGVGETVVAKWAQNSYYEGKVDAVTDAKATIKWNDGSSASSVDLTDVFPLPKARVKPDVKTGDLVLAKISSQSVWNDVEVSSIDGEVYAVKTPDGRSFNVSAEKIIRVPADVAANFRDKAKANDFAKQAQSKKPTAPSGWKAKVGDKVLGEWSSGSWWQAKITAVSDGKVTAAWEDGSKPSELSSDKVIPMPSSSGALPAAEKFVLAKPETGSKWIHGQVTATKDGSVEVKLIDGKTRTLKGGEFVVLE